MFYTNKKMLANGSGWQLFGTELPHVYPSGLEINYRINKIRIGLYGRGVWENNLFCPSDVDLNFTTSNSFSISNTFQEASNNIFVTANTGDINITGFTARAGNDIRVSAMPNYSVHIGPNSHLFIHPCDKPGNSFRAPNNNNASDEEYNEVILQNNSASVIHSTFDIYPNPTEGLFTLKVSEEYRDIEKTIIITDLLGKVIWQSKNNSHTETTINLSHHQKGIYFVKVITNNGIIMTKKLIVL